MASSIRTVTTTCGTAATQRAAGLVTGGVPGAETPGDRTGGDEQAASVPRIAASTPRCHYSMLLLILEALGALLIFVFIVWWTMFSGRKKGERREEE